MAVGAVTIGPVAVRGVAVGAELLVLVLLERHQRPMRIPFFQPQNCNACAKRLLATWRLFLLSTDEIWGYKDGDEWLVSHYPMAPAR